jgi:multicomponent Na+:H+ antiporter subunit B
VSHHLILRIVAKFLIPLIFVFGLYIQFHGEYGPGGGFQAGVVFAAGFILHALIFGLKKTTPIAPVWLLKAIAASGVLVFGGTGVVTMLLGGNFLDYDALAREPTVGQQWGILIVEFGVGLTVASVVILIFYLFAGRQKPEAQ